MPVASLSAVNTGRGLPILGTLHKGESKDDAARNKHGFPVDLKYFRVEWESGCEHYAGVFAELYGKEPDTLPRAFLASSDPDSCFPNWLKSYYATGVLKRQCNGVEITRERNAAGRLIESGDDCHRVRPNASTDPAKPACDCQLTATLFVTLYDFTARTGATGVFRVKTGAQSDVATINGMIADMQSKAALLNTNITMIPIIVSRRPAEVPTTFINQKGEVSRTSKTQYLIRLDYDPLFMQHFAPLMQSKAFEALLQGVNAPAPDSPRPLIAPPPNTPAIPANVPTPMTPGNNKKGIYNDPAWAKNRGSWTNLIASLGDVLTFFSIDDPDTEIAFSADNMLSAINELSPFVWDSISELTAFTHTAREAIAAALAYYCQQNVAEIERLSAAHGRFSTETRDLAINYAVQYNTAHNTPTEPNNIPL